jgi:tetratricopeptide (TPR) repeat protein
VIVPAAEGSLVSAAKQKKKRMAATVPTAQQVVPEADGRARLVPWVLVAIVVVLAIAVRIHLLGIPLERDEGEYAYGGQLLLHGIPPYKLIYSMKFPGIYAAYALIMAVFGQTITGIHLGLMLVNAFTIVLIFLLGKRVFSAAAGVAAAAAYALLSIGQGVFGTQAHATHFVVLAALGGTLLLLRGIESRQWSTLLLSGVLFGTAVLMKQHGFLFVAFAVVYLAWERFTQRRDAWLSVAKEAAIFLGGVMLPLLLTGLALWRAGVFDKFWFWTFTYAFEYAQEVTLSVGISLFRENFIYAVEANLALWLVALAGLVLVWWRKEDRAAAAFITGFLVFSFLAVCPGLYFRGHYFVLMLPAIALLAGAAVGTALKQWPGNSWLTCGVYGAALIISVFLQREYLFQLSALEISREIFAENPFNEAIEIGDYLRTHSAKDARIAILGSEPEIPFYAHRLSVSGHVYMYGLMEDQPYALTMQEELIHEVEMAQPDYVVVVTNPFSWLKQASSAMEISNWWTAYQPLHYRQMVGVADMVSADHTEYRWDDAGTYHVKSASAVMIYKRSDPPDFKTAQLFYLGDTFEAQGKQGEAAQEYSQVLELEPNNYIAHFNLGAIDAAQGMTQEALHEFQLCEAVKPDLAMVHYRAGRVLMQTHRVPEAIEEFNQAVRLDPQNPYERNDLGVALYQQGDYEKAIEQFRDAASIDPTSDEARENYESAQADFNNLKNEKKRK